MPDSALTASSCGDIQLFLDSLSSKRAIESVLLRNPTFFINKHTQSNLFQEATPCLRSKSQKLAFNSLRAIFLYLSCVCSDFLHTALELSGICSSIDKLLEENPNKSEYFPFEEN